MKKILIAIIAFLPVMAIAQSASVSIYSTLTPRLYSTDTAVIMAIGNSNYRISSIKYTIPTGFLSKDTLMWETSLQATDSIRIWNMSPGTYTIPFTVTDINKGTTTANMILTVMAPPAARKVKTITILYEDGTIEVR